jgi:indole-3-glycerol phosphate synthase
MTILEKIIETKKNELEIVKKTIPIEELKKLPNFERKSISLVDRLKNSSHGIIATTTKRRNKKHPLVSFASSSSNTLVNKGVF